MMTSIDDAPWLNLTPEEMQELRTKKHELTEYGKQKIKQLMMNQEPYPDAMFEEAERREKENEQFLNSLQGTMATIDPYSVKKEAIDEYLKDQKENQVLDIAKNLMEENKEAFQHLAAIERKEFAEKDFEDLTRDQKIQLALEEIDWIVIGGQDGQEFYGSIQFLRKVLRSLGTPEQPSQRHTRTDLDSL